MATILVVEDERAVRNLVGVILAGSGHKVILASNGLEAISLFRSSPQQFDMVLTDIVMPVMDGLQLIQLIRQTSPRMKIVCMSGYTDESIPAGAGFLRKPFPPGELIACVDQALQRC